MGYKVSDFLGNLAAKSLKLTPVVRPRPVSFFEPARAAGALGQGLPFDALSAFGQPETDNAPALPQRPMRPRSANPFAGQPLPADRPDSAEGVSQPPVSAARPEHRTRHLLQPAARPAPVVPPPVQAQPSPNANAGALPPAWPLETENRAWPLAGSPSPRRPQPTASYATPTLQAPARALDEGSRPDPIVAPAPPAGARENASDATHRQLAVTPASERMAVERTIQDRPRLIPAAVADLPHVTSRPDSRSSAMDKQAATPTIQVTIGRIEVRATPAALPARKERSAPQVMSLDDYLRQRSQGGGR